MRLGCGLTYEGERRRREKEIQQRGKWRRVFAWRPVQIGERNFGSEKECAWLEWVEMREQVHVGYSDYWFTKEYRALEKS